MKKTLIALALVSLPVAASAEVILYGKIRGGVEYTHEGDFANKSEKNAWGVVDYSSYIGFKGSEDLGGNLKAIWQVESLVDIGGGKDSSGNPRGFATRDSFIGLEGGFGTVKVGYVSTPLRNTHAAQDQWEYSSDILGLGRYTRFSTRRTSLNYQSPDFAGFNFEFQMAPGKNAHTPDARTNDGKPAFGLGLGYKNSGFFARYAVDYARKSVTTTSNGLKDSHVHNLSAGYDANNLYVAGGIQYGKNVEVSVDSQNIANTHEDGTNSKEAQITAAYTFGAVTPRVSVAYGRFDSKDTNVDGARYVQAILGADYAFSRRTTGIVSTGWIQDKVGSEKTNNWGVGTGLVHKF